jgi:hypothetical protein
MSISHFEVQRADDNADVWYNIGLSAHTLHDITQIMTVYDSEGTMKLRVWDSVRDEPVHYTELFAMSHVAGSKTKIDWKQDGF